MSVATFRMKSATRLPDRPALTFHGEVATYAELQRPALALGGQLLARGLHTGEKPMHAAVVPEPGTAPTAADLIDFCGQRMAGYNRPKGVDFVDELPTSAYGNVLRREVRARYWHGSERAIAGGGRS